MSAVIARGGNKSLLATTSLIAAGSSALVLLGFSVLFWTKRSKNNKRRPASSSSCSHDDEQDEDEDGGDALVQIQDVLKYWFGQFPPEIAQKKLWMISQQNVERRNVVDAEIAEKFGSLLLLLPDVNNRLIDTWCSSAKYGMQGKVAAIIVLDQFSRHIHRWFSSSSSSSQRRITNNNKNDCTIIIPSQETLDAHAYKIAVALWEQHGAAEIAAGMLPIPMCIFALLPFRHANNNSTTSIDDAIHNCQFAQQQTEMLDQLNAVATANMIGAFRKATNRRLAVLQDAERRRTGGRSNNDNNNTTTNNNNLSDDDDILECGPFLADMSTVQQHVVYQTILKFLQQHNITTVIVSLSGGVDSMVIASVLAHIVATTSTATSSGLKHVAAVHIDYGNRPESAAEADYLQRHCSYRLNNNLPLTCRRIHEVTRGITARDDYERIARDIRYQLYRDTLARLQNDNDNNNNSTCCAGVMLGHHRGDLRENVLSNAHKGCGPLDLSGMTAVSQNNGVTLLRPLLTLEKSAVYHYAHTYGVPYFKDTTPHWSTRGKLRNKLLPLLQEIYGDGSLQNLSRLAVQSDECRALLYTAVIQPFMDAIVYKPMGIYFPTQPWKEQGTFFWKFVLREALHSAGLGMFTDKSIVSFMERCCCGSRIREGWLQCRKDYAVYLQKDGRVFVFYPESFPWNKTNYFECRNSGQSVEYGVATMVGPWRITAEVVDIDNGDGKSSELTPSAIQEMLDQKAFTSMETFMDGKIEYYTQVPTTKQSNAAADDNDKSWKPRPLVFTCFDKQSRPRAWKGVDTKIQDILPLLGEGRGDVTGTAESPIVLVKITMVVEKRRHE